MTMTDDDVAAGAGEPGTAARAAVRELAEAGLLDRVVERAEAGELALTGEGGFLPEMVKAVLERGLAAELTEHLGYEKGDPAGRGSPNSRNGTSPKTLATEVGDGAAGGAAGPGRQRSSRGWCPRAPAGPAAWTR